MSIAELRQEIDRMPPAQRVALKHYLVENFPQDEVIVSSTFDERMAEMDAGSKVGWDEVKTALDGQASQPM